MSLTDDDGTEIITHREEDPSNRVTTNVVLTNNFLVKGNGTTEVDTGQVVMADDGRLTDVTNPTNPQDAATKDYVDSSSATDISCKVTKTADQSIPRITLTMVTWDSEEYDTDEMHDNVTNNSRITFNTAGKYSVLAQSEWEVNSGGFRFMDIMKNGVDSIARVRNLADNASEHNIAFVGEFAVGDYIELEVFQDTGGSLDFESGAILENTYLEAHKIN